MNHDSQTRRTFLTSAALGAPVAAVAGVGVLSGQDTGPPATRRVLGGSASPVLSRAVIHAGLVYVSGMVGRGPGGEMSPEFEGQARQVMENIRAAVEEAGSSMDKVLKCTCFLTDVGDFAAFNRIYARYFPADPPARSTVVVKELVVPGATLEVDCMAGV